MKGLLTFFIYRVRTGWRWRCRAANGEIIAMSETYKEQRDARRCVELLRKSPSKVVTQS